MMNGNTTLVIDLVSNGTIFVLVALVYKRVKRFDNLVALYVRNHPEDEPLLR